MTVVFLLQLVLARALVFKCFARQSQIIPNKAKSIYKDDNEGM